MSHSSDYLSEKSFNVESTYDIENNKSLNFFLEKPKVESQVSPNPFAEVEPKQISESIRSIDSDYHNPFKDSFCYKDLVDDCADQNSDFEQSERVVMERHSRFNDKESVPAHPEDFKKRGSLIENDQMNHVSQIALHSFRNGSDQAGVLTEGYENDGLLSSEHPSIKSSPRRLPSNFSSFKELELYNPSEELHQGSSQLTTNNSLNSQDHIDNLRDSLNGKVNLFKPEPRTDYMHMSLALNRRDDKNFDSMRNAQEGMMHGHAFSFRMNL